PDRATEAMEYAVGTIHAQGFTRLFRTERFAPSPSDHEKVKAQGREQIEKGFAIVDEALAGKDYLGGSNLSAADAALFYVEYWGAKRLRQEIPKKRPPPFQADGGRA